jgi:hypothetical protein
VIGLDLNAALMWWAMWACVLLIGSVVTGVVIYVEWRRWMG